jgi:hypothetical protein
VQSRPAALALAQRLEGVRRSSQVWLQAVAQRLLDVHL